MNLAEPGTDRYKFLSGLIDGVVTLGLDPANLVGAWVGKLGKAGKVFKVGETAAAGSNAGARTLIGQGNRLFQVVKVTDDVPRVNLSEGLQEFIKDSAKYDELAVVDVGETILKGHQ